jgi:hypothetical protein
MSGLKQSRSSCSVVHWRGIARALLLHQNAKQVYAYIEAPRHPQLTVLHGTYRLAHHHQQGLAINCSQCSCRCTDCTTHALTWVQHPNGRRVRWHCGDAATSPWPFNSRSAGDRADADGETPHRGAAAPTRPQQASTTAASVRGGPEIAHSALSNFRIVSLRKQ